MYKIFYSFRIKTKNIRYFLLRKFFTKEMNINFLPSANYVGLEIIELFEETKNMIIFF